MGEKINIRVEDGGSIKALFHQATKDFDKIVLIVPGVGIRGQFYNSFAQDLAKNGIASYVFDYREIGWSKPKNLKKFQASVSDWAEYDIEAVLQHIMKNHPDKELNIIAHSGGGTILGLAPSASKVKRILMVASPQCLRSNYEGSSYLKMCIIVYFLYPVISKIMGYFPSKSFRIGENLPKGVALEWAKWGRHPKGMEAHIGNKIQRFHNIHSKMKTFSFDNDFFASEKCVLGLSDVYKNADNTHHHIENKDLEDFVGGHFCFFKKKYLHYFCPLVIDFFEDRVNDETQRIRLSKEIF